MNEQTKKKQRPPTLGESGFWLFGETGNRILGRWQGIGGWAHPPFLLLTPDRDQYAQHAIKMTPFVLPSSFSFHPVKKNEPKDWCNMRQNLIHDTTLLMSSCPPVLCHPSIHLSPSCFPFGPMGSYPSSTIREFRASKLDNPCLSAESRQLCWPK